MRSYYRNTNILCIALLLATALLFLTTLNSHCPLIKQLQNRFNRNQYKMIVDRTKFPFTDLQSSRSKKGSEFWKAHKPSYHCPPLLLERVGGSGPLKDGGKWVCGLQTLAQRTHEEGHRCVVYSFGIGKDSSFEAEILQKTLCSVYAYDPNVESIANPLQGDNSRLKFKKIGISGKNSVARKTLKTLMAENGDDFIDILKVDVEGHEYESFYKMMNDFEELPFGQLLVEVHNGVWKPKEVTRVLDLLRNLERKGSRMFSLETNPKVPYYACEYSFINIAYRPLFQNVN